MLVITKVYPMVWNVVSSPKWPWKVARLSARRSPQCRWICWCWETRVDWEMVKLLAEPQVEKLVKSCEIPCFSLGEVYFSNLFNSFECVLLTTLVSEG